MIWFVGAGCYHPDMLTIGAKKCLEIADCVLYDHLVNPEFLQYTQPHCERICVGKRGFHPSFPQTDIEKLLVEKAQLYANVVRLKGGDPFLFARGSEEMEFVLQHGCDCQYVPGISSAIGALGYAGIPVTERHIATGFSVYTMHAQDGKDPLDYEKIAKEKNTQIFFMGSHKIKKLASECLRHGMPKTTTISIGSHLTYPGQKVHVSTLEKIIEEDLGEYTSPLLIVLGDVGKNQELLSNVSRLPYFSRSVLFCATDKETWPIEDLALTKGVYTYLRQVLNIRYDFSDIPHFEQYDALLFVSRHAVEAFFTGLEKLEMDIRSLYKLKIFAIGKRTQEALRNHGLCCDHMEMHAQAMYDWLQDLKGLCVICSKDGKTTADSWRCYSLEESDFSLPNVDLDAICVTCPKTIQVLNQRGIDKTIPLFCYGHKSLEEAKRLGFKDIHVCPSSKEGLVQGVLSYFGEKS